MPKNKPKNLDEQAITVSNPICYDLLLLQKLTVESSWQQLHQKLRTIRLSTESRLRDSLHSKIKLQLLLQTMKRKK